MLSTFIKLPFVIKIFVLSIFERPLKTGFTAVQIIGKLKFRGHIHYKCTKSVNPLLTGNPLTGTLANSDDQSPR